MFKSVFCFERKFDLLKRTFDLLCMLFLFRSMLRAGKTVSKPVHTGVFNCYESKLLSTVFQACFFSVVLGCCCEQGILTTCLQRQMCELCRRFVCLFSFGMDFVLLIVSCFVS